MTQDLHYLTITELSKQIRDRAVSPVEVVEATLMRIEAHNPTLNAFITILAEQARKQASLAEEEIKAGNWRGPLHGIPVGVKDFYDTAEIRTTAAFEQFLDRVPTKDAVAVTRLKEAGAILIGKTNMDTMGDEITGLKSYFGPVINPWSADFISGGSSSGSAAAVASGLCYATLDTDAIGSARLPATMCGVVGFKPTPGLIDPTGVLADTPPPENDDVIKWLAHPGMSTRSAADAALMLDALAKPSDAGLKYADAVMQEHDLRVGVASNISVDEEVSTAFSRAVELIRGIASPVTEAAAPYWDFGRGFERIEADRAAIDGILFNKVDVLILPTMPTVTPMVSAAIDNPQAVSPVHTMFANYYGLPAASVPCGFDARGMPIGLQIVGRAHSDGAVLELAHRYQTAAGISDQHPPLA